MNGAPISLNVYFFQIYKTKMDHSTYMLVDFWSAERVASLPTPGWFSGSPPSDVNSKAVVPRSSYAMDGEHGVYHGWCYHWFYWVAIGYNGWST